jgi:hypothetical protein
MTGSFVRKALPDTGDKKYSPLREIAFSEDRPCISCRKCNAISSLVYGVEIPRGGVPRQIYRFAILNSTRPTPFCSDTPSPFVIFQVTTEGQTLFSST